MTVTPPVVGSWIGPFELCAKLGEGGMGIVYEARLASGGMVALKLLQAHRSQDERARRRFENEGAAGSIVRHAHVAATFLHGETPEGVPYLVMQRIRGEPLGRWIRRDGPPGLYDGISVLRQVLSGLEAIHTAGVVHGDVKSDNVLVDRVGSGGTATLIDFGLAHTQFEAMEMVPADDVADQMLSGTPAYMAPEVIRGEATSRASDLYSAGVILYELVTGAPPFSDRNPTEIARSHLEDQVVPPSLRRRGPVPAILERIVLKALAKRSDDRFRDATQFATALAVAQQYVDNIPEPRAAHLPPSRRAVQTTKFFQRRR